MEPADAQVDVLRQTVTEEVRGKCKLELLKSNPTVRTYRDLFWSLDIEPTKTRLQAKPCLDKCLHGKEIRRISTVVDSYSLASLKP